MLIANYLITDPSCSKNNGNVHYCANPVLTLAVY